MACNPVSEAETVTADDIVSLATNPLINQALLCYFYSMKEASKAKLVQKIIQRDGIPALSPLAIRLVELAADDQKGAQDLADIIEKDPALTTRLLKLAGSAFFARPVQVTSIPQAVVLLGFKRVRLMALTLSLRDTFTTSRK
ncbi:MAG: HDOD domain-containing protein, partial [Deltaproteobacteria bacterium]|nr:HDOD domain-containing protein [Deltaproteobacteria bacterium]